jgi:hypothetical protein
LRPIDSDNPINLFTWYLRVECDNKDIGMLLQRPLCERLSKVRKFVGRIGMILEKTIAGRRNILGERRTH